MKIFIFILFSFGWIAIYAQPVQTTVTKTIYFSESITHIPNRSVWGNVSSHPLPYFNLTQQSSPFLGINSANQVHGMFCKMEYKIEQKSKLAPRFRLGSLNYTEWMEGKRELFSRYWK